MATTETAAGPQVSATPILDCYQRLPKARKWKQTLGLVLWFTLILLLPWVPKLTGRQGFLSGTFHIIDLIAKTFLGTMFPPAGNSIASSLLLPLVAIYCCIVIHELGHIAAGLSVGFRSNFLIVYPFRFTRTRTGWVAKRERMTSLLGAASMLPQDFENLRVRIIVYVVGGPASNLITFLILRAFLPNLFQAPNQTIWFLEMLANASLLLGSANLLPFRAKGFESDGARLLMAAADERRFARWFALFRLAAASATGTRPRDLDPSVLRTALEFNDNSSDCMRANLLAYSWASDSDNLPAAAGYLEKSLTYADRLAPRTRSFLMLEAALFQGWYREDAARAAHWLRLAGSARKKLPALYHLRAEAAVAWAEGRVVEAQGKLQEVISAVRSMPANAFRDVLENSMDEWQRKMQLRLQSRQSGSSQGL